MEIIVNIKSYAVPHGTEVLKYQKSVMFCIGPKRLSQKELIFENGKYHHSTESGKENLNVLLQESIFEEKAECFPLQLQ